MKLTTKFNLVLFLVFALGLGITGALFYELLQRNARSEIIQRAGMMMEAAIAIRGYTVSEIRPLLRLQNKRSFLPQTVPAYSATQTMQKLRETHPEYTYKEATLNPTNPRDRATDWEADIIQIFRNQPEQSEVFGQRDTPTGPSLFLARPIKITNPACLTCHSTVTAAPESMISRYGIANGFGWELDEIVGAQIVSVPMSVPLERARITFIYVIASLGAVFLLIMILLNILLRRLVIKPVIRMSETASEVSMGKMDAPEFVGKGKDEISSLAASFNRMRRSLENAMKMLEE